MLGVAGEPAVMSASAGEPMTFEPFAHTYFAPGSNVRALLINARPPVAKDTAVSTSHNIGRKEVVQVSELSPLADLLPLTELSPLNQAGSIAKRTSMGERWRNTKARYMCAYTA